MQLPKIPGGKKNVVFQTILAYYYFYTLLTPVVEHSLLVLLNFFCEFNPHLVI